MEKIIIAGIILSLIPVGFAFYVTLDYCENYDTGTISNSNSTINSQLEYAEKLKTQDFSKYTKDLLENHTNKLEAKRGNLTQNWDRQDTCAPVFGNNDNLSTNTLTSFLLIIPLIAAISFLVFVIIKFEIYFWLRRLLTFVILFEITSSPSKKRAVLKSMYLFLLYVLTSSVIAIPVVTVLITYAHEDFSQLLPFSLDTENVCRVGTVSSNCIFEYLDISAFVIFGIGSLLIFGLRLYYKEKEKGINRKGINRKGINNVEKLMYPLFVLFLGSMIFLINYPVFSIYSDVVIYSYVIIPGLLVFNILTSFVVLIMEIFISRKIHL